MDETSSEFTPANAPTAHAAISVVPPQPLPWYNWRRWGWNFLTFSILLHVVFGVVAAFFIVATITAKKKPDFKAPGPKGPSAATRSMEHKVSMAKKQSSMSAPPNPKRVTTTGISKTSLPTMPTMPQMAAAVVPAQMSGMAGNVGALGGFSGGGGSGGGGGGGGGLSLFGLRKQTGGSLVGRLYDLKQDRSKRPTNMDDERYDSVVKQFVQGGFNPGVLASYYQASVPLYATQMFTPNINADEAPKAFGVEAEVQPRKWIAVYSGKVIPQESGNYKFVGFGDDVLVVRFNGRVVLDRGYTSPSGIKSNIVHWYNFDSGSWYKEHSHNGGHGEGTTFTVEAGKSYEMQVLIGELPGGVSMFQLMIMKEGVTYKEDQDHNPILPVFRLAGSTLPQASAQLPPFSQEGPIWKAEMPSGSGLPKL